MRKRIKHSQPHWAHWRLLWRRRGWPRWLQRWEMSNNWRQTNIVMAAGDNRCATCHRAFASNWNESGWESNRQMFLKPLHFTTSPAECNNFDDFDLFKWDFVPKGVVLWWSTVQSLKMMRRSNFFNRIDLFDSVVGSSPGKKHFFYRINQRSFRITSLVAIELGILAQ